jgi:hypothetical protein
MNNIKVETLQTLNHDRQLQFCLTCEYTLFETRSKDSELHAMKLSYSLQQRVLVGEIKVEIFPVFYGRLRFITVFTTAHHRTIP